MSVKFARMGAVLAVLMVCGAVFAESPLAFYPFIGNANDLSGWTGRNATVNGASLTADRLGTPNRAYAFTANGQSISSPLQQGNGAAINAYSIAAWFKTTSADTDGNAIVSARGEDTKRSLTLCMSPGFGGIPAGRIFFGLDTANVGFGVFTNAAVNDGNWHHVVGVFSSGGGAITNGNFSIYLDGLPASVTPVSVGTPGDAPVTNTSTTLIGKQATWGDGSTWNGSLGQIAIYNRALNAGDAACLHSATGAMKSVWNFDTPGDLEGWRGLNQIVSGPVQLNGQMQYTTADAATDPMLGSPMMSLPRAQGNWLKVRAQNGTPATFAMLFWDDDRNADFTGGYERGYAVNPSDTQVSEYWADLSQAGAFWSEATIIQQFRFDFPNHGGGLTGPVKVDQIAILAEGPPAPTVASVRRHDPAGSAWTDAEQVSWDVRFSHSMSAASAADFAVVTTGSAAVTNLGIVRVGPTWYRATVNTAGKGTYRLNVVTGGGAKDVADQALAAGFTTGETHSVDREGTLITVTPVGQTQIRTSLGARVEMAVTATGGAGQLASRWLKDNGAGFVDIPGALGNTFVIDPVVNASEGKYVCAVTDGEVTAYSAIFTVTTDARMPAAGGLGLLLLAAAFGAGGVSVLRRRK